jgi:ferredoxin
MKSSKLPVGSYVRIDKPQLQTIVEQLRERGYRTVGPRLSEAAVVYDDITGVDQLPIGFLDEQDGGKYRVQPSDGAGYFDYVVGPHSLKNYIFPPRETLLRCRMDEGQWQMETPPVSAEPLAVIGVRSCDLHALEIQDRVFLSEPYVDSNYEARRNSLFLVAVNCRRAAATCFCHSMKTGPAVRTGYDLALTELTDRFVVEVGTDLGGQVVTHCDWGPCTMEEINQAREQPETLRKAMLRRQTAAPPATTDDGNGHPRGRFLDTTDIRDLLLKNLEHERWEAVGHRCLACGNCTMVCPTCFCSDVEEVSDLLGRHVQRERIWASCFTAEHSYMNSGTVRKATTARYRQWLTHKLASWIDQYGVSGCTGCGRCITWCPVGIDLTEEVAAIRGADS